MFLNFQLHKLLAQSIYLCQVLVQYLSCGYYIHGTHLGVTLIDHIQNIDSLTKHSRTLVPSSFQQLDQLSIFFKFQQFNHCCWSVPGQQESGSFIEQTHVLDSPGHTATPSQGQPQGLGSPGGHLSSLKTPGGQDSGDHPPGVKGPSGQSPGIKDSGGQDPRWPVPLAPIPGRPACRAPSSPGGLLSRRPCPGGHHPGRPTLQASVLRRPTLQASMPGRP